MCACISCQLQNFPASWKFNFSWNSFIHFKNYRAAVKHPVKTVNLIHQRECMHGVLAAVNAIKYSTDEIFRLGGLGLQRWVSCWPCFGRWIHQKFILFPRYSDYANTDTPEEALESKPVEFPLNYLSPWAFRDKRNGQRGNVYISAGDDDGDGKISCIMNSTRKCCMNMASVNTFPTLGVRLSKQMSHEWRSVVVSFVIKDGLSCGWRVQHPTVLFAVIIWIHHGVSFERHSTIGQCCCFSKQAHLSGFLCNKAAQKSLRFHKSVSHQVNPVLHPLYLASKGKTIFWCFHPAPHRTACCAFCGDFCFIRCCTVEQALHFRNYEQAFVQ